MTSFTIHNADSAPDGSKALLATAAQRMGAIPNLYGVLAEAPIAVEAYDALHVWIREQEKEIAGSRWESYLTDPGKEPNPAKWKTELLWPIR